MKIYSIIVLLFFASCMNEYSRITFTHYSSDSTEQNKYIYTSKVPKGFTLKTYKADGESGIENQYLYSDSSMLYISDFGSSLNEQNIRNEGYASKKFEYIMQEGSSTYDTLILSGKNANGLYWKEIVMGNLYIGYLNVNLEKKSAFDNALETFKIK